MMYYAIVFIAALPVGLGLGALAGLWSIREPLRAGDYDHPRLKTSPLSPLFGDYKPEVAAWYDVADMTKRLTLTCVTVRRSGLCI